MQISPHDAANAGLNPDKSDIAAIAKTMRVTSPSLCSEGVLPQARRAIDAEIIASDRLALPRARPLRRK